MSNYKFKGRVLNEYFKGVDGVKIDIIYWQGNVTNNSVNSQIGSKIISTTTDIDGRWNIEITSQFQILTQNANFPFTFTFSKTGLETKIIKNPRIESGGVINFTDLKTYIDPNIGGILNINKQYKSGFWKVTSLSQEFQTILDTQMDNLMQFIKNHPNNTRLTIESSESLPGNSDNEPTSPTFNDTLNRGVLATKRANDLKAYVLQKLNSLSPSYPGVTIPNITINTTIIGKEKWRDDIVNNELMKTEKDEEDNPITNPAFLNRYKKDQWVKLYANLIRPNTDCFDNGYLIFDMSTYAHACNGAVYEVCANGIPLKRDDGKPFASLNNNNIYYPSRYTPAEKAASNREQYLNENGIRIELFQLDIYDNASPITQYHLITLAVNETNNPTSNAGRFKEVRERQVFPTPTTPIPINQKPIVWLLGGGRYNRFIIDSQLFREIKSSSGQELIRFTVRCTGISNSSGIPYNDKNYGVNCHPGVGDFQIYKLIQGSNNTLIVEFTSDKLPGKTPANRDELLWIFTFDPCTNRLEINPDVFSSTSLSNIPAE